MLYKVYPHEFIKVFARVLDDGMIIVEECRRCGHKRVIRVYEEHRVCKMPTMQELLKTDFGRLVLKDLPNARQLSQLQK